MHRGSNRHDVRGCRGRPSGSPAFRARSLERVHYPGAERSSTGNPSPYRFENSPKVPVGQPQDLGVLYRDFWRHRYRFQAAVRASLILKIAWQELLWSGAHCIEQAARAIAGRLIPQLPARRRFHRTLLISAGPSPGAERRSLIARYAWPDLIGRRPIPHDYRHAKT
jgi:hypothetical protein